MHVWCLSFQLLPHWPGEKMDSSMLQPQPQHPVSSAMVNGSTDELNNNHQQMDHQDEAPKSYDDLFPSLPPSASGSGVAPTGIATGRTPIGDKWARKPMLAVTTVTQVVCPMTSVLLLNDLFLESQHCQNASNVTKRSECESGKGHVSGNVFLSALFLENQRIQRTACDG